MSALTHATYAPTGTLLERIGAALRTAYVNLHLRVRERQRAEDADLLTQIKRTCRG